MKKVFAVSKSVFEKPVFVFDSRDAALALARTYSYEGEEGAEKLISEVFYFGGNDEVGR